MDTPPPQSEALRAEYERILTALETDLKESPDESWQALHAQKKDPALTLKSELSRAPEEFKERLVKEFLGAGPLEEILLDPEVTEILIMGEKMLLYEKNGKLQSSPQNFLGKKTFERFVHQCLEEAGIVLNLSRPYGDGLWRGFRVHAVQPPVSQAMCLSLRRQSAQIWSLERLLQKNWCDPTWARQLSQWMRAGKSMIIYGDTGSGKTATAEALLSELPQTCRTILLEDTRELRPPNDFSLSLLTRRAVEELKEITFSDLLKQSLRMRPDRIIMGEIRGEEAKDYLMVLASGHAGGLATLHAPSARQALIRLEMLVQLGAPQWDLRSVRVLIAQSVHYLLKVGRDSTGCRRLLEVSQIDGLESSGLLLESFDVHQKPLKD